MKKLYIISFFLFNIVLSSILCAQTLEMLLDEGDKYFKKFDDKKALIVYDKADDLFPENFEIKCRLSRSLVNIADLMPNKTDEQETEQLKTYEKALANAEAAIKIAPNESNGYLRKAIANGKIALFKGVFSVSGIVNQVNDDLKKAISLGTGGKEIQAVAHYVLARTHAKVSEKWKPARSVLGLGWADIDSAAVEYKRAISLKPNFTMFYVDYAVTLMKLEKYQMAKQMLEKAINAPVEDKSDKKRKEEAKSLMEEVKENLD